MNIRKGVIKDFEQLNQDWAWDQADWQRESQKTTIQAIHDGKQEFWVIEADDHIIGELHISWEKEDKDDANGQNRAYLFALRIHPEYRGQGLGTKLMFSVLQRVKENGYAEATIGAYKDEPHLKELYKKWGFTEFVKEVMETNSEYSKVYELFLQKL
jgi:ribosomal protein S18 acetylase RimI-like enzyme